MIARSFRSQPIWFTALIVLLMSFGSPSAFADDHEKGSYYLSLGAAASLLADTDISSGISETVETDTGFGGLAALGYYFTDSLRGELESGYLSNDVDGTDASNSASGDISAIPVMANLIYDINTSGSLTPFIGAGLGLAMVDFDGVDPVSTTSINDDATEFAYQGIAGLNYAFNERTSAYLRYQYLASDADLSAADGSSIEGEYQNNIVSVGVTFRFGGGDDSNWLAYDETDWNPFDDKATEQTDKHAKTKRVLEESTIGEPEAVEESRDLDSAPMGEGEAKADPVEVQEEPVDVSMLGTESEKPALPAAPALDPEPDTEPAPELKSMITIFFNHNSSVITSDARQKIKQAARTLKDSGVLRIVLEGHADTTGTESYNDWLSARRARAVKAELVNLGMDGDMIATEARGERDLLVQTANGVMEPRNRRVEIIDATL